MFIVSDAKVREYCPVLWDSFKKFLVFLEKSAFLTQIPPKCTLRCLRFTENCDDEQKFIFRTQSRGDAKINIEHGINENIGIW